MLSFLISISLSANPLLYDSTTEPVFAGTIAVIVRNCDFSILSGELDHGTIEFAD
jgi:hypothetical protein